MARISVLFTIALLSILSNTISAKIITARSCRPSLPVDWFVHESQSLSLSSFSPALQLKFQNATNLSAQSLPNALKEPGLNAITVAVAGPWGTVFEGSVGTLRFNDSNYPGKLDGDSIYRIASISKFLTVLELLILEERGCLSFFDSPLKWFPDWNISKDVTLEALASHMAGLGRDRSRTRFTWVLNEGFTGTNAGYCGPGLDCTFDEALDLILGSEPDFPVFAQPSYSNDGFVLLGKIIEAAHGHGKSYDQIIQEDIFDPLCLKHCTFRLDDYTRQFAVVPNDTSSWNVDTYAGIYNPMGGAYASTNDFTALFHDLFLSDCPKLLTKTDTRHWLRSLFTIQDFASEVGMPWEIYFQVLDSGRYVKVYTKAGDLNAFHTVASINPSLGFSVMAFTAGTAEVDTDAGQELNDLFAPLFEEALLELWNNKYGGRYQCDNAVIDISVNLVNGSIELTSMQIGQMDTLFYLYQFNGNMIGNRSDIISYLWPGIDDNTFRFTIGFNDGTDDGAACSGAWLGFDGAYASNGEPLDLLRFIEKDGKIGITYPAANVVAWKV